MVRVFDIAERVVNGVTQTKYDENLGPVVVKWEVPEAYVPIINSNSRVYQLRAIETVKVPGYLKGFIGAANTGLNVLGGKINKLFNSTGVREQETEVDYNSSFKPVCVHTGLKVELPDDEILIVTNTEHNISNGLIYPSGPVHVFDKNEIGIYVLNLLPVDITIEAGDIIGTAYISKIHPGSPIIVK